MVVQISTTVWTVQVITVRVLWPISLSYNECLRCSLEVPLSFHPGDEIRVTCEFDTTTRNTTTGFGEGTADEMCYAFLTYYPADPTFTFCRQHRTADVCSSIGLDCDMETFTTLASITESACTTNPNCSRSCEVVMQGIVDTGCLDGDIGLLLDEFFPTVAPLRVLIAACGLSANTETTGSTAAITTPIGASPSTDSGNGSAAGLTSWDSATAIISIMGVVIASQLS